MPIHKFTPQPSTNREIRELQERVLELQPVDSATVKWTMGPTGMVATARILPPLIRAPILGFRAQLITGETNTVKVWRGYRRLIGDASEMYGPDEGDEWTFENVTNNQTIYFGFTYSTNSTPGAWITGDPQVGTEPADTDTTTYIRICTLLTGANSVPYLMQRHLGDAVVEDRLVYEECPA